MMMLRDLEAICYETNEYDIYKRAYEELKSRVHIADNEELLAICTRPDDSIRFMNTVKKGVTIQFQKGTVLSHICPINGLKELKSSFRSIDGCLYSGNRIYFFTSKYENSFDRLGNRYFYTCDGTEEFHIDMEFEADNKYFGNIKAVYLEKDNPFTLQVQQ